MSFLSDRKGCSRSYICPLCQKSYDTPWSLAEHYVSTWHERKVQSSEPQEQNGAICLSSFLKAHMKEDTIVGLEYVMEMKKDSSYTYTCRLCKEMNTNLPTIVQHIVNSMHTERYIDKHFKYLLPPYRDRDRRVGKSSEYLRVLKDAAVMITEQQGSKEIQVVLLESDGKTSEDPPPSKSESDSKTKEAFKDPPPSKLERDGKMREASKDTRPPKPESDGKMRESIKDPPPSKPESGNISHSKWRPIPYRESRKKYRYNKVFQKSNRNDSPLAKRSRHSPDSDQDVLPSTSQIPTHGSSHYNKSHAIRRDCTAPQELEFRTNDEFFEYFANFVISNDEDVVFIRTITQNCIKALTRFKQEEIERRKTSH